MLAATMMTTANKVLIILKVLLGSDFAMAGRLVDRLLEVAIVRRWGMPIHTIFQVFVLCPDEAEMIMSNKALNT